MLQAQRAHGENGARFSIAPYSLKGGADYVEKFGTVLAADEIRKYLPGYDRLDYHTHVDRTKTYVGNVFQATFDHLLSTRKDAGNGSVVFLAGGNGAGKSTAASKTDKADFIVDSTLGSIDAARKQIQEVLDNGQLPSVVFVYRDPFESIKGVVGRAEKGGHLVSPLSFANSHTRSAENVQLLAKEFGDKIDVTIFKNTKDGAVEITLGDLAQIQGVDHEQIRREADRAFEEAKTRIGNARDQGAGASRAERGGTESQGVATRFSIGGIYTGTSADYDKPSLHFVGKSNGVAFGWGLYGSSTKSDAENFGGNVYGQTFFMNRPEGDESHLIEWDKPLTDENKERILDGLTYQARHNPNVKNAVEKTIAEEDRDFGRDQEEDYETPEVEGMADDILREAIERTIDVQTDSGKSVYTHLAALLTGKSLGEVNSFAGRTEAFKAASEFLRDECDIDGIKYPAEFDGAKRGETHYVSFRDDNIRVDHKWVDGDIRFSINPNLRAEVDAALNTDKSAGKVEKGGVRVNFCDAPPLFRAIGISEGKVYSKAYILRKIAKEHNLTAEQIASAPNFLEYPAAVFDDHGNGYIFLTEAEAMDEDGKMAPVMFYLREDSEGNFIASAYARKEKAESKYVNLVNAGKVLYFDKNKVTRLPLRGEAQSSLNTFNAGDKAITPERVMAQIIPQGGAAAQARFSIGGIYTGSAADESNIRFSISLSAVTLDEAKAKIAAQKGVPFRNYFTDLEVTLSSSAEGKLVSKKAAMKSVKNGFTFEQHNAMAANVGELFERGFEAVVRGDKEGDANIKSIRRYACPVSFEGKKAFAWITVKESKQHGAKIYSVESIELEAFSRKVEEELMLAPHALNAPTRQIIPQGGSAAQARFSIGGIYTGTAADYEKPSLHYVGTGEGAQVYGWGLYGSNVRGVAEGYAKSEKRDKAIGQDEAIYQAVKKVLGEGCSDDILQYIYEGLAGNSKWSEVEAGLKRDAEWDDEVGPEMLSVFRKNEDALKKVHEHYTAREHLYEQTFFTNRAPGDESHLLSWYEPVSEEQLGRILEQYAKENNGADLRANTPSGVLTLEDYGDKSVFEDALREMADEIMQSGESLYRYLQGTLGSPKAASEFLARADIDGVKYPVDSFGGKSVKDGDKVGWNYVSFRDDNIRVDHKWVDGEQRFSVSGELLGVMLDKAINEKYGVGSAKMNGEGFVDLEKGDTFDGIEDYLKLRVKEEVENTVLGISATIGSNGNANELARHAASGEDLESHKFAAKNALMLFKKSKTGMVHHDKKGTNKDYIRAFAPFYFKGEVYLATITLRRDKDSDKFYSIESVLTKKDAVSGVPRGKTAPFQDTASGDAASGVSRVNTAPLQNAASQESGDSPRSSRRTAQEAQSPVSLEDKVSYYVGDVNATEPKFLNSDEEFSLEKLLKRIRADIVAFRSPMRSESRNGSRASMSFAYPNLAFMSNEELFSAAIAAKMALGKSDKVSDRMTTVNAVQKKLRAIHPDWDTTKVALESQRILGEARTLAKSIRGDIDRGVSDSLILEHLPQTMRSVFGEEMTSEARRGWRLGMFQAKAEAGVERRIAQSQERIMRDALEVETGMMHGDIERSFGVDLAATLLHVKENEYLKVLPKSAHGEGNAAANGEDAANMGESVAEEAFSAGESVEELKPKVSAFVQAIAERAEGKAQEEAEKRRKAKERVEKRVESEDINDRKGDEEADVGMLGGGEFAPEEVVAEAVKAGVDLNNPLSFTLFVMEMARTNWVKKHNLKPETEPAHSLVYLQFQRKTLQDVYSTLAKRITYSRGRETVMNALARLDKVTTMRGLIREAEFMGKLVGAKMIRESAQAMCERLDNLLRTEFQTGRQFKPDEESLNRKVPAMLERQARYMRHAMWLTPDGVSEETRALLQEKALAGSEFDEHGADKSVSRVISEADMKLKILADWGALKYRDLAEVEAAVQWWLDAAEGGADKIAQEWDVREARTLKAAGVLAKAMRNPKRKTAVDGKGFLQKANEVWQGHFLFHHLMEDLTRFASDEDRAAAQKYIDWLDLEIQKAGTRVASERIVKQEELRKAVEAIYGKSFREVISQMNAIDGRFEKYMGESDDGVKVPATKARALQLLVSLQQIGYAAEVEDEENPGQKKTVYMGGYWENIVENGRVGQAEEMLSLMSDADLNFIKWMRQWYEKNRAGISETCERIFGVGVYAELGNYMPVKMLLDPKGLENGAGATWQIYPKALTPRVRNKRDFDTSADIFTMWSERLEESIQWKHHAELGIELRGIFGRSELQKAIRANHGAKVLGQVKGFVTDILNGKGVKQEMMVNPFLDKARQFAALGGLGGNVGVMIKQTTSIPAFGFEIGVWRTFRHLVGGLTAEGMEDIRKIAQSEEFRNRWHDGYSEEVANALSADNPGLLMRLWMKSMVTNKAGDCVPALLIGHGIYRDGINEGLSERDAMARTWMIVERTQQSSRIENRTAFQRRNALGNAIYQFLSTQNQMLNYEVRAIRDVIADPKNPKKWGNFVQKATLVHFVLSSFYCWAGELYKAMLGQEPSEDQLKDWVVGMIVGPVGALYGVGTTTVDAVESWVKGYSYGSNNAVPALSWLGQVVVRDPSLLIHDIFDGKKSWDDVCDDMLRWLSDFNATFRDLRKIYRFRIQEEKQ